MKSVFTLYTIILSVILVTLFSPLVVNARVDVIPDSIDCDSLDSIIKGIYEREETFSDRTQEIADRLLFLTKQKKCNALPAAYTLLGTIHYNLNDLLESVKYLLKADSLLVGDLEVSVMSMNNIMALGLTNVSQDNLVAAEFYFKKAVRISKILNDTLGNFGANLNLGLAYVNSHKLEEAKGIFYEAEKSMSSVENTQLGGYVYQNLARIFIQEKNYPAAIENTKKAHELWEKIKFNKGLFFCNSNFALIYEEQKDTSLWINYLHKLIQYTGKEKAFIRHYPYMKLGNYHFGKGEEVEATEYYELALKQSQTIAEDELMAMISNLFSMYSKNNDYESIKRINNEVLDIYSYKSKLYTNEASKWADKEIELEEKSKENRELQLTMFDKVKSIKLRNTILVILLGLSIAGLFYFQKYKYEDKLRLERQKKQLRNKISKDLHDDVGSILAGISASADLLEILPEDEMKDEAKHIVEDSKLAMGNMRDRVWAMDSRSDTISGLKVKMTEFASKVLTRQNIGIHWTGDIYDDSQEVNSEIKLSAYLIFKEAIANIIKHSDTSKVDVSMNSTKEQLSILIRDYGSKADPNTSSGQGLKNMAFRAEKIGGKFDINLENGCVIQYSIPLTSNERFYTKTILF